MHPVAIVLNLPEREILERNTARQDRRLPEHVIHRHVSDLRRSIRGLKKEGFRFVYVLNSEEEIDGVQIVRTKLWNDKKDDHGPFDIIGDIHGCYDELVLLLHKLGYTEDAGAGMKHPAGRKAVFLGDLCDRGPKNVQTLRLVMAMVRSGNALAVPEENAAAALEVMSRFATDPRWLIYLPPTMSPCETSPPDGFLEHPFEAFAYYRKHGVKNVVCEKKHMDSGLSSCCAIRWRRQKTLLDR